MNRDAERIYTFLGFAQKAGKLASGENTVEAKMKDKGAKLVIVAEDAPEHTKERFQRLSFIMSLFFVFGQQRLVYNVRLSNNDKLL